MKVLLIALALWPGTMLAQSCGKEDAQVKKAKETLKTAETKLKQCKNKPSPEALYNKEWRIVSKRQQKERADLARKHSKEHSDIVKRTGFDPDKKRKK